MLIKFLKRYGLTKRGFENVTTTFLILSFFFSNIPYGALDSMFQKWRESNIVDLMWQAENSRSVVDSFKPSDAEAAQVTIEADLTDATAEFGPSPNIVFTTEQTGYMFFIDLGNDLVYRKTTNGGTNWGTPVVINNVLTGWTNVSVWYDRWTPGDTTGTKIHIAAADDSTGDAYYTFLDTSSDTLKGSVVSAIPQTLFSELVNAAPSITKGGGGALFLTANFATTAGGYVYKSTDGAGDTWSNITPASWSGASVDQVQLLPLLTDNDIIAIKTDTAADDIDYRVYDEVADSWDGSWTDIAALVENATYDQWFSATIKKSTGDVYLTFNNNTTNAANDIEFWSFNNISRTWTAGANVRTNSGQLLSPVPLVDEETGDIYVSYLEGQTNFLLNAGAINSITYVYYQKSSDGGVSWTNRAGVLTEDLGDDYKYLRGNLLSSNRLFVAFYDDDDEDIFGTTIWSSGKNVEANIDTASVDVTDQYGPSPSGVFVDDDVGYKFYVRTNVMLDATDEFGPSPAVVFTDANTGYVFFIDSPSDDLVYRKTIDGGVTWSGSNVIDTSIASWTQVSVWYDQWTPGDTTGTKIHIAAISDSRGDALYTYVDTSNDSISSNLVTAINQTTFTEAVNGAPSITKGASGNLFLSANFATTAGGYVVKSTDGGDNWTSINPSASASLDQIQLLPLLTDDDIIAIRADSAGNDMDYQIYDEVGDAWSGSWTSIASMVDNSTYDQWFSATLNKATGDIFLTFTNSIGVATGDIEFWTLDDGTRAWTKGTDVVSNLATILTPVPYYRPSTGVIYVAYSRGTLANTMQVYFKSSTDGGATWSAESASLSTTGDDFKTVRGNMMSDSNLYVVWYNDDTNVLKGDKILAPEAYDLPIISIQSLSYRKTVNGGKEWGPPYTVAVTDGTTAAAVWYDQWTPGDTTGTKIHISFSDDRTDDYYYSYFDTATDRPSPPRVVILGTVITELSVGVPGITKGASGNLFLSGNFNTTAGGLVAKSTNGGDTWTGITPASWSSAALDQIQLLPLIDDNDVIAIRTDTANNDIDYRIYDEVGDAWAGSWTTIASLTENATYDQWFSATLRKSTADIYLAFANNIANAANDIGFWSFDDSSRSWTQGADVYTNSATVMMPVPLVNEGNGDIYVGYLSGTLGAAMNVYYKKSIDGGVNWSNESNILSPGIFDDVMSLRGTMFGDERLYLFWYNDDLDDIYGNVVEDDWELSMSAYRFFGNTDSTDVGSPLNSQDSAGTLGAAGDPFRLRVLVQSINQFLSRGESLKLQFAEKSGVCDAGFSGESYVDVTGSTDIAFYNNPTPSDGATLTGNASDPTYSGATAVNQTYVESNNFTNSVAAILSSQVGKWDFSLIDNGAPINTSYCFRIVRSDGSLLDSYNVIPEVVTADVSAPDTLSFSISDNSIGFGTLTYSAARFATGDTTGSSSEVEAHTITASTNGASGYIITINGATLTSGSDTIDAIGGSNTSSAVGTEQFGIRLTATGGNGAVTTPYALSGFALDTASFPDEVASDPDGDDVSTTYSVRYLGNVSPNTEAGSYNSTLTYVITAGF